MYAVCTFKDFPIVEDRVIDFAEAQGNARMIADNILANQKVLYIGHASRPWPPQSPRG